MQVQLSTKCSFDEVPPATRRGDEGSDLASGAFDLPAAVSFIFAVLFWFWSTLAVFATTCVGFSPRLAAPS